MEHNNFLSVCVCCILIVRQKKPKERLFVVCFKDDQSLDQDITSLSAPLENDTDQGGGGGGPPHENTDGLDGKRRLH